MHRYSGGVFSATRNSARDLIFFFFFFTQVQTPVTLCSGELWSILVVRLAHSADLRSQLRHVSSAPSFLHDLATIFLFSSPSVIELSILTCTGTTTMFECLDQYGFLQNRHVLACCVEGHVLLVQSIIKQSLE